LNPLKFFLSTHLERAELRGPRIQFRPACVGGFYPVWLPLTLGMGWIWRPPQT
jgi:hypothetical protein